MVAVSESWLADNQLTNLHPNPRLVGDAPEVLSEAGFSSPDTTEAKVAVNNEVRQVAVAGSGDDPEVFVGWGGLLSNFGMCNGRTYTFAATLELERHLSGVLCDDTRRITVWWGLHGRAAVRSEAARNMAGSTRLAVTFEVPDDVSEVCFRLVAGASRGHGVAYWSRFSLTESHLEPPFFDGDSEDVPGLVHSWTDTRGDSPSVKMAVRDTSAPATPARLEAAADAFDVVDVKGLLAARPDLAETAEGAYGLGVVAEAGGHQAESRRHYRLATELKPELWGPRFRRACQSIEGHRVSRALRLMRPVMRDARTPPALLDRLSRKAGRLGRLEEARELGIQGLQGLHAGHYLPNLDVQRMAAAQPRHMSARAYVVTMLHQRIDEVRERAHASLASAGPPDPRVFVFWAQGFDVAPPLVKACYRRLVDLHDTGTVVTLSASNMDDYVELPAAVVHRVGGNLTKLSNVLRLELLKKYGGYWADATCWFSRPANAVDERWSGRDFFAYQRNDTRLSNWFLGASNTSYIAHMTSAAHDMYWETHDHLIDYFIFHDTFEALAMVDPEFANRWEAIDHLAASVPHELQRQLFAPYSYAEAQRMKDGCVVQKLTFKFDREVPPKSNAAAIINGTF